MGLFLVAGKVGKRPFMARQCCRWTLVQRPFAVLALGNMRPPVEPIGNPWVLCRMRVGVTPFEALLAIANW